MSDCQLPEFHRPAFHGSAHACSSSKNAGRPMLSVKYPAVPVPLAMNGAAVAVIVPAPVIEQVAWKVTGGCAMGGPANGSAGPNAFDSAGRHARDHEGTTAGAGGEDACTSTAIMP